MSGFTNGEWQIERDDDDESYEIFVPVKPLGRRVIATVEFGYTEPAESEQHANAKLLAAAPKLQIALANLLAFVEGEFPAACENDCNVIAAHAALAKVTGEEK